MSIRNGAWTEGGNRTRQWLDSMAVLPSYAESSYQETVVDLDEAGDFAANDAMVDTETICSEAPVLDPIPEFDSLELAAEEESVKRTKLSSDFDDNPTRGATSTSATVPVLQTNIEANDPVGAPSAPPPSIGQTNRKRTPGHILWRPSRSTGWHRTSITTAATSSISA